MISLYVHVPFCRRKCPYCDFYSSDTNLDILDHYHHDLIKHLQVARLGGWKGPVKTLFFGGGTPSLLTPNQVALLVDAVDQQFGFAPGAEITMEGNPSSLNHENLSGFRNAGVNRLSIGVQSLDETHLTLLGRQHTAGQAEKVFCQARKAGFDNLGADLMFALPGESLSDLERDLDRFLRLEAEHLSCYGLTIEPGTEFAARRDKGEFALPDEDRYADQYQHLHDRLSSVGYRHYEIANYCQPGFECQHNLNYWQRRSFLGIGAGAHSFSLREWGVREAVPPDLERYSRLLAGGHDPAELLERFDREGATRETVYLALRSADGLDAEAFLDRFGESFDQMFADEILKSAPWLSREESHWRLQVGGWLIFDHLISRFL
ncbi:MAG: coproporphyrinogen III oxidase [Desulfuromonas sp.]|nr:MAG: coproporphyrinogen III oxidase [Desulfuromonas sp.]